MLSLLFLNVCRSVFGSSVSGRSSPESISEDLAEPTSFHDKFSSGMGGKLLREKIRFQKLQ